MVVTPAVTTCRDCHSEYRLGRETTVYFSEVPAKNYFDSTCPRCESSVKKVPVTNPEALRRSLVLNNFSPCNRVVIIDERELEELWKEELK